MLRTFSAGFLRLKKVCKRSKCNCNLSASKFYGCYISFPLTFNLCYLLRFIIKYFIFIEFLDEARSLQKSLRELSSRKIEPKLLVHCSNGAGRTGVFVLCETLIRLIENNQVILCLKYVFYCSLSDFTV